MLLSLGPLRLSMASPAPSSESRSPRERSRLEDSLDQCPVELLQALLFLLQSRQSTTAPM